MPELSKELNSFWNRTIRPSWLFRVSFPDHLGMSKLNDHMVTSVQLPTIPTTDEKYIKSSKLYPELFTLFDFSGGIPFSITFEENLKNHVEKTKWSYYKGLIFQGRKDGGIFYSPPLTNERYIDNGEGVVVDILDFTGNINAKYIFKKCLISSVDGSTYSYDSQDKISPTFSFKAQEIETYFEKE